MSGLSNLNRDTAQGVRDVVQTLQVLVVARLPRTAFGRASPATRVGARPAKATTTVAAKTADVPTKHRAVHLLR
jgi:hypothetical protein